MKTTYDQVSWNKSLASALEKNYSTNAVAEVLKGLEQLIQASSGMITLLSLSKKPKTICHRLLANENPKHQVENYNDGAFLLDPFYIKAFHEKASGIFVLDELIPEGFEESEYYNHFYKQLGYVDEVNVIIQVNESDSITVSLVRQKNEDKFSEEDINQLEVIYPTLKVIFWQWFIKSDKSISSSLESQIDNALANFGSSILTPKESEILQLILHGHAIKSIAQKLQNSIETIRHHRKNIYNKLDISSQSELFYLFIASVQAMPDNSTSDPMTYLT
ncbi:MAG: helix-turn-helix transcriptional regulator [Gammaproteobacteria bacterium]|nr:helix-turn-helix transcriptional regulator [Gammaproteobacteria bacterium]